MRASTLSAASKTKTPLLSLQHWLACAVLMFALPSIAVTASLAADPAAATAPAGSDLPKVAGVRQLRGQAVIDAVPKEARGDFVAYQLAKALNNNITAFSDRQRPRFINPNAFVAPSELPIFEALPVYADFGSDLLLWLQDQFTMTQMDMFNLLQSRSILCTSQGVCYSQNEVGQLCCPF